MGAITRAVWLAQRRRSAGQRGQVLVIFAISITVLFAAAGLAFDVGRFYSERRFLQNAADAGALAIANALIRGDTQAQAIAQGQDVLTRNFSRARAALRRPCPRSPRCTPPVMPATRTTSSTGS